MNRKLTKLDVFVIALAIAGFGLIRDDQTRIGIMLIMISHSLQRHPEAKK